MLARAQEAAEGRQGFRSGFARGAMAVGAMAAFSSMLAASAPAEAQSPPRYFHRGQRWIGAPPPSAPCQAPAGWRAERLFASSSIPGAAAQLCLYSWTVRGRFPTRAQVDELFTASGAPRLTEDVPVLGGDLAMSHPWDKMDAPAWSEAQLGFFTGLRGALLQQVGTAALLVGTPSAPARPVARVVVIDSAPDARHGAIRPGAGSRHGDTLARLIEDLVCLPPTDGPAPALAARASSKISPATWPARRCVAEVTSELALPWASPSVMDPSGGHSGTLADLARAIERATLRWKKDRRDAPRTTPPRLILNLSLGWEHQDEIADCHASATAPVGPPAAAVQAALQFAAAEGALVIAAAGNDAGGLSPPTGLTCPGRYQALARSGHPSQPLLIAVSGVDYGDRPLETARQAGNTAIVALGFGGVAWSADEPAPPALTGSSVATAVVSAVSGLVWAHRPEWSAPQLPRALHDGGAAVDTIPDACPASLGSCATRRASACGALLAAGAPLSCAASPPAPGSSPSLPAALAALIAAYGQALPSPSQPAPIASNPRYRAPSAQVEPWTFPSPISATCPTCFVGAGAALALGPELILPQLGRTLREPMLLLRLADADGTWLPPVSLGAQLQAGGPYRFPLDPSAPIRAAYLSGFAEQQQHSVTEQLYVQP